MILLTLKENEQFRNKKKGKSIPKYTMSGPSKEEQLAKIENPKLRKIMEYESSNL